MPETDTPVSVASCIVVVAPRPVKPCVWKFRRGSKMWSGSDDTRKHPIKCGKVVCRRRHRDGAMAQLRAIWINPSASIADNRHRICHIPQSPFSVPNVRIADHPGGVDFDLTKLGRW